MIENDHLSSPLLLLACLAALVMVGLVALHGAADSARRRRRTPLAELAPYAGPPPSPLAGESLPRPRSGGGARRAPGEGAAP